MTYHQESRQLELCQHLTDWVICDSQPLTVLESPAFKQLIFQLDPNFEYPIQNISNYLSIRHIITQSH